MARLIDAEELQEHLFVGADYDKTINDGIDKTKEEVFAFQCGWNDALKSVVQFAPTVDAEPVVRCRDCKHYWKNCPTDKTLTSTLNAVCLASPKDDAFCSEGEWKEDETD